MPTIEELRKNRLKKLEEIKKRGINPYPSQTRITHKIKKILDSFDEFEKNKTEVILGGRIRLMRIHGRSCFIHFEDESGRIQGYFREDILGSEQYRFFIHTFDVGDFIEIKGTLFYTKTKEKTILAKEFRILAKAIRPLPEKWHGLKDIEERYRKRYLDLLMNPEVKEVFRKRSQILRFLREYLDRHGFLEVETSILQPIYGGASARPFITHLNALDLDLYLRISDELYLKRLIVGGFDKVYEVSKDFRNEGIDRQHNPEFTQIEFYWAYADYNDLMTFTEEMLCWVIKKICKTLKIPFEDKELNFTPPWQRISYRDLVLKYTQIDIDKIRTEKQLLEAIKENNLEIELEGVVGYGALLDRLYKQYCRPHIVQPTFVIDHPVELISLAKRKEDDPNKVESFQLLVAGYEVIKAYSELNNPLDQKERWLEQERLAKKGLEEHEVLDEDYIEALEYGMPPTAGWGIGIDRFSAIITNQRSIRDVILFPLMRPKQKENDNKKGN